MIFLIFSNNQKKSNAIVLLWTVVRNPLFYSLFNGLLYSAAEVNPVFFRSCMRMTSCAASSADAKTARSLVFFRSSLCPHWQVLVA